MWTESRLCSVKGQNFSIDNRSLLDFLESPSHYAYSLFLKTCFGLLLEMGRRLNICSIRSQDSFCTVRIYVHALLCLLLSAHVRKQMARKTKNWWIRIKHTQDFLHYACSISHKCEILPNKIYENLSSAYTKIRRLQTEGMIEPCKDRASKRDDGTMYSEEQLCGGDLKFG